MKRMLCVALTVGVTTALALPNAARAATPPVHAVMNLRGPLVNATFSTVDPTGCVQTDVFVTADSGFTQNPPAPRTATAVGAATVYRYDSCTGTTLLDAAGETESLPAGALTVSPQLDTATLRTTFTMSDLVSGGTFDVAVNMTSTGTSDIARQHSNTNELYPGCHIINRWKGSGRDAVASGTVSDGSENFAPGNSQFAEIGYVIDGSEIIGCP